jgi:molybdopterin synthase catalytic subunit
MAEAEIERLLESLAAAGPRSGFEIRHRVGRLDIGEPSVAILATSPHRARPSPLAAKRSID